MRDSPLSACLLRVGLVLELSSVPPLACAYAVTGEWLLSYFLGIYRTVFLETNYSTSSRLYHFLVVGVVEQLIHL